MIIQQAKTLVSILQKKTSEKEEVQQNVSAYYKAIKNTPPQQRNDQTAKSMGLLCSVFNLNNPAATIYASQICGSLIENGFNSAYVIDQHISFIHQIIDKIQPLIQKCKEAIQKNDSDEVDPIEIIDLTIENLKTTLAEEINALNLLDQYYGGAIAAFAFNKQTLLKAKKALATIQAYQNYSEGFLWLSKLLSVLVDEPIMAIDLQTQKGIIGKMNGITDNYQLQWLLMGLPDLNEEMQITPEQLNVIKGLSLQQSLEQTIEGKWNMYEWTYIQNPNKNSYNTTDWIWGEGIPSDISKYQQYRVVLLDKPTYARSAQAQRTFYNLVAEIEIEKVLSKEEIAKFLNTLKTEKINLT